MENTCTVYRTADFIGKRWTLLILLELYKSGGSMRYSEIKRSLPGITSKMLAERLRELEKEDMISKRMDGSRVPIVCEYSLTEGGADFIPIIKDIKSWALKWKFMNKACMAQDCGKCAL